MSTVEVVVRRDGHGAEVWEIRNVDTFALKGDPAKIQKAMLDLNSEEHEEILDLFNTERFIPTENDNYKAIETVARTLGIIK